ncbi:hypothetical protein NL529_29555, partial [Klebsiella pneumoniae]|nr:hypothetical protein [Klebsiella pneumoniae]
FQNIIVNYSTTSQPNLSTTATKKTPPNGAPKLSPVSISSHDPSTTVDAKTPIGKVPKPSKPPSILHCDAITSKKINLDKTPKHSKSS